MAEDMIERAARAHAREASEWALRVNKAEIEPHEIVRHENPDFVSPVVVESYPNYERATRRFEELRAMASARAALLAALDPEDEATVERVAYLKYLRRRDGTDDWNDPAANTVDREFWRREARADLRDLSRMAQGVSVSQEQVREKD